MNATPSKRRTPLAALALATLAGLATAQAGHGNGPPEPAVSKVESADGTAIAYERSGSGPVLVLVSSALSDRSDAARLASLLAPSFTVINYDRRGRGDSGDAQPFAVRREIEDVEALIDAAGGTASLFGSSSGAVLALEAADALPEKVTGLVLFEPPLVVDGSRPPIPESVGAEIGALLDAGRRGDAVARFMIECVEVPEPMVASMKQAPMWAAMEQRAPTLRYDFALLAGLQKGEPLPKARWRSVAARTLVIDGEASPPYLRNAAQALADHVRGAQRRTLVGHDHSAVYMAPQVLVEPIREFLASEPTPSKAGGKSKPEARRG